MEEPISMLPSALKATVPVAIWPSMRPEPSCTSLAGLATSSAFQVLAVEDFSRFSCKVRWPPWLSDTGAEMVKSGLVPVLLSAS